MSLVRSVYRVRLCTLVNVIMRSFLNGLEIAYLRFCSFTLIFIIQATQCLFN